MYTYKNLLKIKPNELHFGEWRRKPAKMAKKIQHYTTKRSSLGHGFISYKWHSDNYLSVQNKIPENQEYKPNVKLTLRLVA